MVGYDCREKFGRKIGLLRFHYEGASVSMQHVLEFDLLMQELRGASGGREHVGFEHTDAIGADPDEYKTKDRGSGPPD